MNPRLSAPDIKEENEDDEVEKLYCEQCRTFFMVECERHGPALFIPDSVVPVGFSERARRTLPPGLEIRELEVPDAGLGVFFTGRSVPVGAHFGPYEGTSVGNEEAVSSPLSWVIYNRRAECEEYIDAKDKQHANWMRYVRCAPGEGEQNLVAFQFRGEILYRCCRPIAPGQELLVWYGKEFQHHRHPTFQQLWKQKSSSEGDVLMLWCRLSVGCVCGSDVSLWLVFSERNKALLQDLQPSHDDVIRPPISNHETEEPEPEESGLLMSSVGSSEMQNLYHCVECRKTFTCQTTLRIHQRTHTGERPYPCTQCGKSFNSRKATRIHLRIHTGERPYVCSHCQKTFIDSGSLSRHQRCHTGEKKHQCFQCGARFRDSGALKIHMRIHTGEKPYPCLDCGKRFIDSSSLVKHRRTHTGGKPYHCSDCGLNFPYFKILKSHNCSSSQSFTFTV